MSPGHGLIECARHVPRAGEGTLRRGVASVTGPLLLAALLVGSVYASAAEAAPRPGAWRLAAEPHQPLEVGLRELGIGTFHTPGRFFAVGFWQGDEFTGLVRRPDAIDEASNAPVKIQLLLAAQLDSTHLGTSTHQEVDPRTAGATAWEWAGAAAATGKSKTSDFATPDTSLGHWRSRLSPDDVLFLTHGDHGEWKLSVPGRFAATGFFTGDRFTGVVIPLNDPATTPARGPRMLKGAYLSDTTLALTANPDLEPNSPEAEVWELTKLSVSAFRARRRAEASGALGRNGLPQPEVRIPEFGDYVFVEELPEALTRVPPHYPDAAREAGVQGTVMVQVLVSTKGTVLDTRVVKSIPGLDEAATDAVKQWVFRPGMANGRPVACWMGVPVKFSIH